MYIIDISIEVKIERTEKYGFCIYKTYWHTTDYKMFRVITIFLIPQTYNHSLETGVLHFSRVLLLTHIFQSDTKMQVEKNKFEVSLELECDKIVCIA